MKTIQPTLLAGAIAVILACPAAVLAQEPGARPDPGPRQDTADLAVRRIQRARSGAGLRLGAWDVSSLREVSGATYTVTPLFEAYWQRGLDRHLVIETGASLWRRTQRAGSGTSQEEIATYVIPMTTSIKFFPASGPDQALEPFVTAGAGFTIGVDDRETVSGGLLGGSGGGTALVLGVGVKGATGVEWRFSRALGLSASVAYHYVRFFEPVGGDRTFRGPVFAGGLTYRFQY